MYLQLCISHLIQRPDRPPERLPGLIDPAPRHAPAAQAAGWPCPRPPPPDFNHVGGRVEA
jgi:hypothetical protein